jgi:hypothetical protein
MPDTAFKMPKQYRAQNPGDSYYDMLLERLMLSGKEGVEGMEGGYQMMQMMAELEGRGWDKGKAARNVAGQSEDAVLGGMMMSSREKREGEQIPSGAYALSDYPGLRYSVDRAAGGYGPHGVGSGSHTGWLREQNDREYGDRMRQGRKDWSANQKALLGWRY